MTNVADFALDSDAWEDDVGDPDEPVDHFDDGRCTCHGCVLSRVDGSNRCEFCAAHCPKMIPSRAFEHATLGILAWRTHLVRDSLDDLGADPVEWWPFILGYGTLDRALGAREECRQMDLEFQRAMTDERA
jgi:hypothetical protein